MDKLKILENLRENKKHLNKFLEEIIYSDYLFEKEDDKEIRYFYSEFCNDLFTRRSQLCEMIEKLESQEDCGDTLKCCVNMVLGLAKSKTKKLLKISESILTKYNRKLVKEVVRYPHSVAIMHVVYMKRGKRFIDEYKSDGKLKKTTEIYLEGRECANKK